MPGACCVLWHPEKNTPYLGVSLRFHSLINRIYASTDLHPIAKMVNQQKPPCLRLGMLHHLNDIFVCLLFRSQNAAWLKQKTWPIRNQNRREALKLGAFSGWCTLQHMHCVLLKWADLVVFNSQQPSNGSNTSIFTNQKVNNANPINCPFIEITLSLILAVTNMT